jgi:hypothetical protein
MVERFQRKKDSFASKNRNVSSKDYISFCYKQITINLSFTNEGESDLSIIILKFSDRRLLSCQSLSCNLPR